MASDDVTATYQGQAVVVGEVRDLITERLADCPRVRDVVQVVSELATNAILHSHSGDPDGHFEVTLERSPGTVRLTVIDQGQAPSKDRDPDGIEDYEKGLKIVDGFADKWAVDTAEGRTAVWAEFVWE